MLGKLWYWLWFQFYRLREWWRMKRRGEVRIAPGYRGRVYMKREELAGGVPASGPGSIEVKARPKGSISARVYRAATGEWEDLGVIAEAQVTEEEEG
jgi:hypothetical protein